MVPLLVLSIAVRRITSPKGIFVIALGMGLLTVADVDGTYRQHLMAEDSSDYVQLADSLLAGQGYTLANGIVGKRIPPLFPLLLASERLAPLDLIAVNGHRER